MDNSEDARFDFEELDWGTFIPGALVGAGLVQDTVWNGVVLVGFGIFLLVVIFPRLRRRGPEE